MTYKPMTLYLACARAEGFGEGEGATDEEYFEAWQYLIDTGNAWTLQGWYGRTAEQLIAEGFCHRALKVQQKKPKTRRSNIINKVDNNINKIKPGCLALNPESGLPSQVDKC